MTSHFKDRIPSRYAWAELGKTTAAVRDVHLKTLIGDDRERLQELNFEVAGLHFDYTKTHLNGKILSAFKKFTDDCDLADWIRSLKRGEIVNPTENRAAWHHGYRLPPDELEALAGTHQDSRIIASSRRSCKRLVEAIGTGEMRSGAGKPYKYLIHLGIGGSSLGPHLALKALSYNTDSLYRIHFVANIDGHCLSSVLQKCQADETLVIMCSKTFSTLETKENARQTIRWMGDNGVREPLKQFVAVTACPDRAIDFIQDESRVIRFPQSIGGRYSVWSPISLPVMLALGNEVFDRFIAGARAMDDHFFGAPFEKNVPALSGMIDVWYRNYWDLHTLAIFCYDQRLDLLIPYCQQLYMESNGKDRDRLGRKIAHPSAPVLWGGVGTEVQHAVFQLMHQGTSTHLPEFIAIANPDHNWVEHHRHLLANLLAQTSALALGRNKIDGRTENELDFVDASRLFSGNRPSTTIVLAKLDAYNLGALLAYYEHRTFVAGSLWGINVYDQMGVELGKEMAQSLFTQLAEFDKVSETDISTENTIKTLRTLQLN